MKKAIRVGIVGAGLIGRKRAAVIQEFKLGKLVAVADANADAARDFAEKYGCQVLDSWQELASHPGIDVVIIAVPNVYLAPIALYAIAHKKHLLCEKPFGISLAESLKMHRAAKRAGVVVKVGFNHRFHAALVKAREIFDKGGIGNLLFIRARYGHGGRKGMEREWRFDKSISGGGELLDQGVHLIDLAAWFAGEFTTAYGLAQTMFWDAKVDDNTFGLLKNKSVTFSFHVSTTNWKNIFSFELFGSDGYLQIDGKGGSYGAETLIYGKRRRRFGVPILKTYTFPAGDGSWKLEWESFIGAISGANSVCGSTLDGAYANAIVEALYKSSASHREVSIRRLG